MLMHENDSSLTFSAKILKLNSSYLFFKNKFETPIKSHNSQKKRLQQMKTRAEIHAVAIAPGFIVVLPQCYSGLLVSFLKLFRCGKKLAVAVETGGIKRKMRYQS